MIPRIIPVLLLDHGGLAKTSQFSEPRYVGDPINAVRIFNEKQVDELIVLDIRASAEDRPPDDAAIAEIVSEAFMPVAYGGGIHDLATATRLIQLGVEKVVMNDAMFRAPEEVARIADRLGSSTVVISIDARQRGTDRWEVIRPRDRLSSGMEVRDRARLARDLGAGEIFLNSVDRDGMREGYDIDLVKAVASSVDVPVIACGGAGALDDLAKVVLEGGASAAAAGSLFVFHGRHRAVLITYPTYEVRAALFSTAAPSP